MADRLFLSHRTVGAHLYRRCFPSSAARRGRGCGTRRN
ncbi:hypothetical protein [Paractinoplanes hotanensis]|uniref:Uncharacterized protein n=1 Tax=Paractinoplanes hotanensis TaxID=2906497 RepID=A0ABT0YDK2_9ACTN|nr:hypothetical protein [Actinoplanes hotanensis]MCM4083567.1 hypothetical protein [Actinoplanes hotanensis]